MQQLETREQLEFFPFVSVVVTVYNAERTIAQCLESIMKLEYLRDKLEIIVVDDGSTDNSLNIVKEYRIKLIQKNHGGYPSAMNTGIKSAAGGIIVIIDSDIVVSNDWLVKVLEEFSESKVGIVGGYIATAETKSFWSRLAGFELEDRYHKIKSKYVDYVSTTCTAYKKEIFDDVGFFDETLRRDSDEDFTHRVFKAGWKIVLRKDAVCFHEWKGSFRSYFKQQMNEAKYAVTIFRKAPDLLLGKKVHQRSLYIPLIFTFLLFFSPVYFVLDYPWLSFLLLAALVLYHLPSGVRIVRKHRDRSMFLLPIAINVRYVAWLIGLAIGLASFLKGK